MCTNRGRCAPPATVTQPPPVTPPAPATLVVEQGSLELSAASPQGSLTFRNTGGVPLTFRVLSDASWVRVEPSSGTVSGQPVTLRVSADVFQAGTDARATLRVNSTGGTATVNVRVPRGLGGVYAGQVRMEEPFPLASAPVQLHLFAAAGTPNQLTGYVDRERSLLYPFKSAVTGTVEGDTVTLTFVLGGTKGSDVNPHYPRSIQRTVTLTGKVLAGGIIEGQVSELLKGPYEARDIPLRGTFRLQYGGPPVAGQPEPTPSLSFPAVTSPFPASAYNACRSTCPAGGDCSTSIRAGDSFLKAAAPFYGAFRAIADGTGKPFDIVDNNCGGQGCLDTLALRCAHYHYSAALTNAADQSAAVGLLSAFEVSADYAMLFGNARMVTAAQVWKNSSGTLEGELAPLGSARALYTSGNHSFDPAVTAGLFDPFALKQVDEFVLPSTLASTASRLPAVANDSGVRRLVYEHLRRSMLAMGGALRASLDIADRQHRLGRTGEARTTLVTGATQAYIDLAILNSLLSKAGATQATFPDLQAAFADFQVLARRFEAVAAGRNPAGYFAGYVPFLLDPAKLPQNNYQQIQQFAAQTIYQGLAKGEAMDARAADREFEANTSTLRNQLTAQVLEYERQIFELCGTQDLERCGQPGSAVALASGELKAAILRIQQAHHRIANLVSEVDIEQQRARKLAGLAQTRAQLVLADGRRLNALEEERARLHNATSILDIFSKLPLAIIGPPPGAGVFGLFGSAVSSVASNNGEARIAQRRNDIEAMQRARVEFDQGQAVLIDSAALIQTKLLETATLELELEIARENAAQAVDSLLGLKEKATLLNRQRAYVVANNQDDTRKLLQFRVYAVMLELKAQQSFRTLMDWAYLATRAMEYERNITYARVGDLWASRSADDVNNYLVNLDIYYQSTNPGLPQTNVEVISVRDQLLDMGSSARDDVTGYTYSPRERFRRFVMDPANRDVNGNLQLTFMTYRPDKPIFSRAVCNDRIKSMRVNLIGDNLGAGVTTAFVRLVHGGTNYLRACGGAKDLVAYDLTTDGNAPRVARVQSGVNAPNHAAALPANTDLYARALLAGPWQLVIDQRPDFEPANTKLDLGGLDDIELVIEHESYTLQ